MHKLPYENVAIAMMLHREDAATAIIKMRDLELSLPENLADLLSDLYQRVSKEYPMFFKQGKKDLPDDDMLNAYGIYGLYHMMFDLPYDPTFRHLTIGYDGALKILEDPKMRRAVQSMAIAKIKDEEIELMLNARYDLNYSPDDIIFFLTHFFDVKDWRMPQLKELVEEEQEPDFRKMYILSLKGDKGYLLWKLGLGANRSYTEMMQEMLNDAFYLFKENSRGGADADLAQKWAQISLKLADKVEKADRDENESKDLFQSLEFNLISPDAPKVIKTMADLGDDLPEFNLVSKKAAEDIPRIDPAKAEEGKTKIKGVTSKKNPGGKCAPKNQ